MTQPFTHQHLERIKECHDCIMREEANRVSQSLNERLKNIVSLFGYGESEIEVTVSINTAYKIRIQPDAKSQNP